MVDKKTGKLVVGVVVDDWKLDIFKKCIKKSGYDCTTEVGPASHTTTIKILSHTAAELVDVVQGAYDECRRSRHH